MILLDTGPAVSLADRSDSNHEEVKKVWLAAGESFVMSIAAVPETCYLLLKYLGPDPEIRFLRSWQEGDFLVEPVTETDRERILEIVGKYKKQRFGFTDAAAFALAERLKIRKVLTFDRRHFGAYRPAHCPGWEYLI
jgi:predicted nucleic acid-binding protein